MKNVVRPLLMAVLMAAGSAGVAHADLLGTLKSVTGGETAGGSSLSGPLGALMGGSTSAVQSSSMANVGGVLQYCVQHKVLDATNNQISAIKDQLLGKLGTQTESQSYNDGLNGILNTKDGKQVDLNNLGSMTSSLKEKVTTKVCDVVLNQAKNLL